MPEITIKSQPAQSGSIVSEIPDPMLTTYFQLNPNQVSKNDVSMINQIKTYLSSQTADEFEQAKVLRDIKNRIGQIPLGRSEIEHIHQYIKLRKALEETEAQVKDMER